MVDIIDFILKNKQISQEQIFAYYLNISISQIYYCLEYSNNKISNPLRIDVNPSLGFKNIITQKGIRKVIATDFANIYYKGDCIDWACYALDKNPRNKNEFGYVLRHILSNCILNNKNNVEPFINNTVSTKINKKSKTQFSIVYRNFTDVDYKYWDTILFNNYKPKVQVASYVEIDNVAWYHNAKYDPCYVYFQGIDDGNKIFKLYRPFTKEKALKFRTNNTRSIEYITELKSNKILVITKSWKDKNVLMSFLSLLVSPIDVTSLSSESIIINPVEFEYLRKRYNHIVMWLDFDVAGVLSGFKNYILYDINTFYLSNQKLSILNFDERVITNECKRLNVSIDAFYDYFDTIPKYNFQQKDISDLCRFDKRFAYKVLNVLHNKLMADYEYPRSLHRT